MVLKTDDPVFSAFLEFYNNLGIPWWALLIIIFVIVPLAFKIVKSLVSFALFTAFIIAGIWAASVFIFT